MKPTNLHSGPSRPLNNPAQGQHMICDDCKALFSQSNSIHRLLSPEGLEYRRNRYSMIKTALDGCNLCREMLCMPWDIEFPEPVSEQMVLVRQNTLRNWPLNYWESMIRKRESRSLIMANLAKGFEQDLLFNWRCYRTGFSTLSQHQKFQKSRSFDAWMSIESDEPNTKHLMNNRLPKKHTTCERTYEKIRNWLAACDTCHSRCRNAQSSMADVTLAPNLILDVSIDPQLGPSRIKLRRMAGRNIAYVALSYCWGAKQPDATLRSNVSTYMTIGINTTLLPKTIQDAIVVTRKLGLQYLWVDSMCIIQDSDDDKAHEIGRMSQIYSNAYVTISASRSKSCTVGFLKTKDPNLIEIPVWAEGGTTVPATVEINNPSAQKSKFQPEPIYSRAWTFQESFMSRRILIYSEYQVFWCCAHDWGKDGGSMSREDYFRNANAYVSGGAVEVSRFSNEEATLEQWLKIIEIYSLKTLSDPMDKLPALSCLASFFAEKMNAKYLAGLWSNAIPTLLCWYPDFIEQAKRPTAWRSPSWSFLSIDGRVRFRGTTNNNSCIIVVTCSATPMSTQVLFGQISSAYLTVRGFLVPLNRTGKDDVYFSHHFKKWHFDTSEYKGLFGRGYYEIHSNYRDINQAEPLWALPLGEVSVDYEIPVGPDGKVRNITGTFVKRQIPWGIILARLPNSHYHRVGYFEGMSGMLRNKFNVQETIIIV